MKKTGLILLALILTLSLCVPRAQAASSSERAEGAAKYSLVTVMNAEGTEAMLGFVVTATDTTTYILTDSLVAGDTDPVVFPSALFKDGGVNTSESIQAKQVWMDSTGFLVLLAIPTTEDFAMAHICFPGLARMSAVNDGDTLYRIGLDISGDNADVNPFLGVNTVQHSGAAIVSSNYPAGQFSMTTAPVEYLGNVMQMGGPVVNKDGLAVGISAYTIVDDALNNEFVISLDELMDALDGSDILYSTSAQGGAYRKDGGVDYRGSSGSGGGSGSGSSSGAGRGSGSSGSSGGSETGSGSRGGSSSGSSGGLIGDALSGGAIGLVAAGAAGVGIWLRKKKKPSGGNGQKTAGGSAPPAGALALVGIGGQMEGCRFPLQGASLTFGRDPGKCAIIYDSGAPGVSSLHCQLVLQEGAWCLTDLSSSYGTYLNGRKLEPFAPSPLRPGDTFWLGQPQNSFTLKEG